MDNRILSLLISDRCAEVEWNSFSLEDWNQVISRAHKEGVAPLLYLAFSNAKLLSSLPQAVRDSLRLAYASTGIQNRILLKELRILAQKFHEADISVVALKGVCFALTIYPDPSLRPMGDMDVLIRASKLSEAVKIAKSLGYVDLLPEASPGLTDLLNHEICLQKTGGRPILLELHHSLIADKSFRYAVPVDWFWEQTQPLAVSGYETLLMLTPTAQILYAASHAMLQHGGKKAPMRWFYDLDRLVRYYAETINWELLLAQSKKFEWGSALDAALAHTSAYFATPIPDPVRASLSQRFDRHRRLVAMKQIWPRTHILNESHKFLSLNWYSRVRLLMALILPSPAYMRWRYQFKSSWSLPYYYLLRWAKASRDLIKTVRSVLLPAGSDTNAGVR